MTNQIYTASITLRYSKKYCWYLLTLVIRSYLSKFWVIPLIYIAKYRHLAIIASYAVAGVQIFLLIATFLAFEGFPFNILLNTSTFGVYLSTAFITLHLNGYIKV